ncbi:hypothetical protein EYB53_019940 [Candidatus Chloroploca sp. M-50]|uniref:SH3 domain-containing protein n=1 Tax=Candidatus Chloroploca mongolica TaxID=2528176 RepID=A0ABS4DF68_9CHLR|nr:hypothetical protein [Candidatus Chloroploca mongolica]MBP1467999.1 hypothetical protein [Candidatus Chloroploca mongolica]
MGYVPPRGADGRIIVGPLFGDGDPPPPADAAAPTSDPPPSAHAPPAARAPAPARHADAPTPFGMLRPGATTAPAGPRRHARLILAVALACLLLGGGLWATWPRPHPAAPPVATNPAPPPAATTARHVLPRAVVAFAAPEGVAVGALEPGRPYTTLATQDGWLRIAADGSGTVWIRAWELTGSGPPTATPTATPLPTATPRPAPPPPPAAPVAPALTCVPVIDGNFGGTLGHACGATSVERQQRALELLRAADQARGEE